MAASVRGSTDITSHGASHTVSGWRRAGATAAQGRIKARGLMPDCSNYTYLAHVRGAEGAETLGVYKPAQGETPLDDFPDGTLGKREVAAYLVSAALDWGVVPLTVYRTQGPLGPGSLQLFIVADISRSGE